MSRGLDPVHRDTCVHTHVLYLTPGPLPCVLVEEALTWKPSSLSLFFLFPGPGNRNQLQLPSMCAGDWGWASVWSTP